MILGEPQAYQADLQFGIGFGHSFANGTGIELQNTSVPADKGKIPLDLSPNARQSGPISLRVAAFETNEVEVADDWWLQGLQHFILGVEVVLKQLLLVIACNFDGLCIGGGVEIDRTCVDVVDTADKEVEFVVFEKGVYEAEGGMADPFGLKADEKFDLVFVLFLQADCLGVECMELAFQPLETTNVLFLGVEILVVSGDVLTQAESLHASVNGPCDHFLQSVCGMGTELARVAVVREGHTVVAHLNQEYLII